MGIHKIHGPGCTCCSCLIGTGVTMSSCHCTTGWTSPSAGVFKTYESNQKLLFTTPYSGKWRFEADMATNGSYPFDSWQGRLFGGVGDTGGGYCGGSGNYLQWNSGTLPSWELVDALANLLISPPTTCSGTPISKMVLNWDGMFLSGGEHNNVIENYGYITTLNATFNGDRFGIGTGTISSTSIYVEFSNIKLYQATTGASFCPPINYSCCRSPIPTTLTLSISGGSGTYNVGSIGGGSSCSVACSVLDGTYFPATAIHTFVRCSEDVQCEWSVTKTVSVDCGGGPQNMTLTVEVYRSGYFEDDRFTVDIYGPPALFEYAYVLKGESTSPTWSCATLGALPLTVSSSISQCTASTTATVTLTF